MIYSELIAVFAGSWTWASIGTLIRARAGSFAACLVTIAVCDTFKIIAAFNNTINMTLATLSFTFGKFRLGTATRNEINRIGTRRSYYIILNPFS